MENKILGWVKLLSVKGIGRATAIKLAKKFGNPYEFIYKNPNKLEKTDLITQEQADSLLNGKMPDNWAKIYQTIKKSDIKFVSILDKEYPNNLKQIFDPPPFLFYKGELKKDYFNRSIAIVGTRKPTAYGRMMTKKIAKLLCENNFTIVSGLAYGIDVISHITAIENKQPTVAVLGTPIDNIYPPGNRSVAQKITQNGVVLSEIIPTVKTDKWSFPERNRIISGLSYAVVVIEGSHKSGSLITAKFALDQNRDIFALPGDVNRTQSEGPNYLIKIGAQIITKPEDILESFNLLSNEPTLQIPQINEREENVYNLIKLSGEEISFDNLLLKTQMSYGELSSVILSLEMKYLIRKTSGNRYMANF